jgi:hypothetical protein
MTDLNITVKLNELVQKGKDEIEACQQAVNQLSLVVKQNTERLNRNSALQKLQSIDRSVFSRLRSEYKDYVKDWENKRGDFEKWKNITDSVNTTFNKELGWYNCNNIANTGDANWRCGEEASHKNLYDPWEFYAYEDYLGWGIGPCHWRHVRCRRKDSNKNKIINEYNNAKPKFSDWIKNKNKNPGLAECRKSNWQCILKNDNSNQGTVRIGWGHTDGDASWACNNWKVGKCDRDQCKSTEIQDIEGKHGPVCKDGQAYINWEKDTDDINYPDDSQYPYDNQEPKFPPVQCCTNINAVAGTAQNIAQTCQQALIQAEQELNKPTPTLTPTPTPTPTLINNNYIIIIIVLVILCFSYTIIIIYN